MSNSINGLELKTPSECGVSDKVKSGHSICAVLLRDGKPLWAFCDTSSYYPESLVPLPKPKTYRPYKRGEVRCGEVFRVKDTCIDRLVTRADDSGIHLNGWMYTYEELFKLCHRLTYENGVAVEGVAGVEQE